MLGASSKASPRTFALSEVQPEKSVENTSESDKVNTQGNEAVCSVENTSECVLITVLKSKNTRSQAARLIEIPLDPDGLDRHVVGEKNHPRETRVRELLRRPSFKLGASPKASTCTFAKSK